jgi:hypothetical protein
MKEHIEINKKLNKSVINNEVRQDYNFEKVEGDQLIVLKMIVNKNVKVLLDNKDVINRLKINNGKVFLQVDDDFKLEGDVFELSFTFKQFQYKAKVYTYKKDNVLCVSAINNLYRKYVEDYIHLPNNHVILSLTGKKVLANVLELTSQRLLVNVLKEHGESVLSTLDKSCVGILNAENENYNVRFVAGISVLEDSCLDRISLNIDLSFDNETDLNDFAVYMKSIIENEDLRIKEEYLIGTFD